MDKTERIEKILRDNPEKSVREIAEEIGVDTSWVYRVRAGLRDETPRKKPKPDGPCPVMSMSLSLKGGDFVHIQLRNGKELLGTIVLDAEGLGYRRPNQKSQPDRKIKWEILDRLMDIGL
jgi:hypothetical protein